MMPLFPKYLDKIVAAYSKLNPGKSKQFNFSLQREEKKKFFATKKVLQKKLIYTPNTDQYNCTNLILQLIKTSIETYITNLIPTFSNKLLTTKNQVNFQLIKKIMMENKENKLSIGKLFLDYFCETLIFTHYTELIY